MALSRWAEKAARFDAFPKVEADNQARSDKGGLLTILLACFLTILTLGELADHVKIHKSYQFLVDPTIETTMHINMDLTVAMPCQALEVHVYDASGQRMHLTQDLQLTPAFFSAERPKEKLLDHKYLQQVVRAAQGLPYDLGIALEMGACRIRGSIDANKIAANLHITAAGHGYRSAIHTDHDLLNFTHRIDRFAFGRDYPELVNPLDNSFEEAQSHFEVFQYFISVVPTTYIGQDRMPLFTNQYAVTDYSKSFSENNQVIPGIFFKYDIEPISVRITESRKSLVQLLVRLCGIIGGSVVTVGFMYRAIKLALTGGKEDPQLYAPAHTVLRNV